MSVSGPKKLEIYVRIDADTFRRFAWFDTLHRRKQWRPPAAFAAIFLVFACVCFAMIGRARNAALLGFVLAGVGIGLPSLYFLNFAFSVRRQIKNMGLTRPRPAYSLALGPDGIQASAGKEKTFFSWDSLHSAYRVSGCVYLYQTAGRAFLLPDAQTEGGSDALWILLQKNMPSDKLEDCRRK